MAMTSVLEKDPVQVLARVRKNKRLATTGCRAEVEVIIGETPMRVTEQHRLEAKVNPRKSVIEWFETELAPQFVHGPVKAQVVEDVNDITLYFDSRFVFDCFITGSDEKFEHLDHLCDPTQYEFAQSVALDYFGPRRVPSHFRRRQAILVRVHSLIKRHWLNFAWSKLKQRASPSRKVNERLLDLLSRNFARNRRLRCLREVFQTWSMTATRRKRRQSLVGRLVNKASFTQKKAAFQALFRNALTTKVADLVREYRPQQAVNRLVASAQRNDSAQGVLSPQSIIKHLLEQHLEVDDDVVRRVMGSPVRVQASLARLRPPRSSSTGARRNRSHLSRRINAEQSDDDNEGESSSRASISSAEYLAHEGEKNGISHSATTLVKSDYNEHASPDSPFPDHGAPFVSAKSETAFCKESIDDKEDMRPTLASVRRAANGNFRRASPLSEYLRAQRYQREQEAIKPCMTGCATPESTRSLGFHWLRSPVPLPPTPEQFSDFNQDDEKFDPLACDESIYSLGSAGQRLEDLDAMPCVENGIEMEEVPGDECSTVSCSEIGFNAEENFEDDDFENGNEYGNKDEDKDAVSKTLDESSSFCIRKPPNMEEGLGTRPKSDSVSSGDSALCAWRQQALREQKRLRHHGMEESFNSTAETIDGGEIGRDSLGPLANQPSRTRLNSEDYLSISARLSVGARDWQRRGTEVPTTSTCTPLSAGYVNTWKMSSLSPSSSSNSVCSQDTYKANTFTHSKRMRNLSSFEIPETPGPESDEQSSFTSPLLASSASSFHKHLQRHDMIPSDASETTATTGVISTSSSSVISSSAQSSGEIALFLRNLEMENLLPRFIEEELTDVQLLVKMCLRDKKEFKETLKEMGISKIGYRERLIRALLEEHDVFQETSSRKSSISKKSIGKKKSRRRRGPKLEESNVVRALQDSQRRESEAKRVASTHSKSRIKQLSKEVLRSVHDSLTISVERVAPNNLPHFDTSGVKQIRPYLRKSREVQSFELRCNYYRRLGLKV